MSLPDKCPFCGSADGCATTRLVTFGCFTMIRENEIESRAFQSVACKDAERARLAARVAELEARCKRLEKAGDNLDSSIACGCGIDGPCRTCMRALEFWQQAKEAKP